MVVMIFKILLTFKSLLSEKKGIIHSSVTFPKSVPYGTLFDMGRLS